MVFVIGWVNYIIMIDLFVLALFYCWYEYIGFFIGGLLIFIVTFALDL